MRFLLASEFFLRLHIITYHILVCQHKCFNWFSLVLLGTFGHFGAQKCPKSAQKFLLITNTAQNVPEVPKFVLPGHFGHFWAFWEIVGHGGHFWLMLCPKVPKIAQCKKKWSQHVHNKCQMLWCEVSWNYWESSEAKRSLIENSLTFCRLLWNTL